MISPPFQEAVFELAKKLSVIEQVRAVILFGSVARGDADARSDIDILIMLERKEIKKEINKVINQIGKTYKVTIQSILATPSFSGLDRNFIENVLKEGIFLYGKQFTVSTTKAGLEPYALIRYETTNSPQQMRNKLTRILYGHSTEKEYKGRKYTHKSTGLVQKYGGWKVGLGTIIVPFRQAGIFIKVFKDNAINHTKVDIWIAKI